MKKILIATASRAERGLLEPIMKELNMRDDIAARWFEFEYDKDHISSVLNRFEQYLINLKPDIVLIPTDRWEMVYVAAFAFHKGHVVAHLHAGDLGSGITDESNRYAISMFSHILFCNSKESKENLLKLGFEEHRIFVVGSTAMDHIEVDESMTPKESFDLVLLHPDPISADDTRKDFLQVLKILRPHKKAIWLGPNKDRNHDIILACLDTMLDKFENIVIYLENIPRSKFLGLLKQCERAIGNSSAFTYELPFLNPEANFIQIGHRNIKRTPPNLKTGGSKRIAKILATIKLDDKLKRKEIHVS